MERFWSKVRKTDSCWWWTAALATNGYGRFWDGTRVVAAHRFAFESERGCIPEGRDLDHLCRNRACVNPAHLEPVTRRENLLRGPTVTARNAAVTHCPAGHHYDAANTVLRRGKRSCRECNRLACARRYRRLLTEAKKLLEPGHELVAQKLDELRRQGNQG